MSDPVVLLSTGDVVGPAGGVTDNSMVLFSGTSGKLIKGNNAVVTAAGLALLDDVDAAAQMVTLGLTATATELNYTDGVTSAIQTQLNGKVPLAGGNLTGDLIYKNVAVGGWARGLSAKIQSTDAYAAGIGFMGVSDSLSTVYLGVGASPWSSGNGVRVTAAGVTISGATTFDTLITGSVNGNAASASTLSGDQSNWASIRSSAVANMLGWKNYGNGHVIFDASNSTSPSGSAVNNVNSTTPWSAAYPTLMGWNGSTTYGVRVDSARVADGTPWTGVSGKPTTLGGYGITDALSVWGGVVNGKTFLERTGQVDWTTSSAEIGALDGGQAILAFHRHGVEAGTLSLNWGFHFDRDVITSGAVYATNLLGQGQTWQNLTGSRTFGVTYTNSTGRPIVVSIGFKAVSGDENVYFYVNGVVVSYHNNEGAGDSIGPVGNIVPAGATYILSRALGSIENWSELR